MSAFTLKPLPLSHAFLDRYRIGSRKHHPPGMMGGHLTHRKGQSLEFREFVEYTPGDDIRYVDWRISARYKGHRDWLVRKFIAEESYTLAISIDTRDTMRLPKALPKVQIAAWLAESLARIALYSDDRVILHRLFGHSEGGLEKLYKFNRVDSIFPTLERFVEHSSEDIVDLHTFSSHLPPAAVWLIITDFYFNLDEAASTLARRITTAQTGWRWILLVDLDSWTYEKFYLGGLNSLRGFDWRDVSAVDEDGVKIGGEKFVQLNIEYLFPLIKKAGLRGLVFFDTGDVYRDDEDVELGDLRQSVGWGVRWNSPIGPFRLEQGFIIDPKEGEKDSRFGFSVGGAAF